MTNQYEELIALTKKDGNRDNSKKIIEELIEENLMKSSH